MNLKKKAVRAKKLVEESHPEGICGVSSYKAELLMKESFLNLKGVGSGPIRQGKPETNI